MKSKKQSAASLKPRSEATFFLDSALGRDVVASALRKQGLNVVVHDDIFSPGTPDADWLRHVGMEGWIVLTKDLRIRYRTNERDALFRAGVRAFVLRGGNLTGEQMAAALVQALPKIQRLIRKQAAPFIAGVSANGAVTPLFPKSGT